MQPFPIHFLEFNHSSVFIQNSYQTTIHATFSNTLCGNCWKDVRKTRCLI